MMATEDRNSVATHHRRFNRQSRRDFMFRSPILGPVIALIGLYRFSTSFFLAKRSMPHISMCEKDTASNLFREWLQLTDSEIRYLQEDGILSSVTEGSQGCWTDRRVDNLVIIVVDALRFDFAQYHLPQSLGARLGDSTSRGRSQLLKFVADPPTVTMQRLKGLTTGGLPTFADISGSFGGADIDEDSWVQQLKTTPASRRGLNSTKLAFVGDDTWHDLFPSQFDDCHPFPSFNTRDLDTVDNGCLQHLPRLLNSLHRNDQDPREFQGFEVVVAHFLGVDHVGHTYGPHNEHMDLKLRQIDMALTNVLDRIDDDGSSQCLVAMILGDHGMTEDGNHGGGTEDEINAALFAHFSPNCGDMTFAQDITGFEVGLHSEKAFQTIHQIDLVPTISILLGLPIPYANLGGLVPSLIPPRKGFEFQAPSVTAILALNAAQVWRYFNVYSQTANPLPSLDELQDRLQDAVSVYKVALSRKDGQDSIAYREASGKFKLFLAEATEVGKRVWTRFDTMGMISGGFILFLAVILSIPSVNRGSSHFDWSRMKQTKYLELAITLTLMLFQCVILTFSNSYIETEQYIIDFGVGTICISLSCRRYALASEGSTKDTNYAKSKPLGMFSVFSKYWFPLIIPVCLKINEQLIAGHGADPSIRLYASHHSAVFLFSLALLAFVRLQVFQQNVTASLNHTLLDVMTIACLAISWCDKRSQDRSRNGYLSCRAAISLLVLGICLLLLESLLSKDKQGRRLDKQARTKGLVISLCFKLLLLITTVTGPSTASSCLVFLVATQALYQLASTVEELRVSDPVSAALWRLTMRHTFFATGHACAFNKLQYSAAFVATSEFYFGTGGASLFLNTFGWEVVVSVMVLATSASCSRPALWDWFYFFQLLETFSACISVSLMRRHLMVWAIFAPRFVFAAIFLVLSASTRLASFMLPWT